jgi:hypothetical protein
MRIYWLFVLGITALFLVSELGVWFAPFLLFGFCATFGEGVGNSICGATSFVLVHIADFGGYLIFAIVALGAVGLVIDKKKTSPAL